jgi:protein-S-isoprenylcysteine O-methyltransferase Ste14
MRAYNRDELVTSGIFAFVRHPIYSAWIVFLLPALALFTASWPFLLMPVVAYTVFKRLVHREDEYLLDRFGQSYRDYRARVSEILPIPRPWQRTQGGRTQSKSA